MHARALAIYALRTIAHWCDKRITTKWRWDVRNQGCGTCRVAITDVLPTCANLHKQRDITVIAASFAVAWRVPGRCSMSPGTGRKQKINKTVHTIALLWYSRAVAT